ncbi:MAG TPA: hypothetical protein VGF60_01250 [Xanthobacteraceae bacterium]|jgi:hypothetical protein
MADVESKWISCTRHRKNADAREQAPRIGWNGSGWNALRLN